MAHQRNSSPATIKASPTVAVASVANTASRKNARHAMAPMFVSRKNTSACFVKPRSLATTPVVARSFTSRKTSLVTHRLNRVR